MVVNINQSFMMAYLFLTYLIDKKIIIPSGSFDIVSIISDMDPYVFNSDGQGMFRPSDLGEGEEWKEALVNINIDISGSITSEETFDGMIAYIAYHKNTYNFDVQDLLDLLLDMKNNPIDYKNLWSEWDQIIIKLIQGAHKNVVV